MITLILQIICKLPFERKYIQLIFLIPLKTNLKSDCFYMFMIFGGLQMGITLSFNSK